MVNENLPTLNQAFFENYLRKVERRVMGEESTHPVLKFIYINILN